MTSMLVVRLWRFSWMAVPRPEGPAPIMRTSVSIGADMIKEGGELGRWEGKVGLGGRWTKESYRYTLAILAYPALYRCGGDTNDGDGSGLVWHNKRTREGGAEVWVSSSAQLPWSSEASQPKDMCHPTFPLHTSVQLEISGYVQYTSNITR